MTTTLHPAKPTAKIQMRDVESLVRERIESGKYEAGGRLPSERELCEELKVHRRVVRSAIQVLEREGLVIRQPNCRATVRSLNSQDTQHPTQNLGPKLQLSRFVALMMWHGDPQEEGGTGQQRIFWGMNQTLGQAGYHTVFLDLVEMIGTENEHADREATHLQYALDQGFGGIVFYCYSYYSNRELLRKVAKKIPLVLIDRSLPGVEADYVGVTNRQGMYDATNYLIGLGHQRIAYVTRSEPVNTVQDRLQGYLTALNENFAPGYYEMVISVPSTDNAAWPALDAILQSPPELRPTAMVCVNDFEAFRMAERLAHAGLRVPEDISIIGCDNIITKLPSGVGLTTTAQPFEEIGIEAAKLFLRRTGDRKAEMTQVECPTRLIVRESCRAI
jgi:GntR family transcriptional regulator of arabinose operon